MARPVVATSLAVEGLPIRSRENAMIADGAAPFAAAIGQLLSSSDERTRIGEAGRALVEEQYTWEACAARYELLYQELAQGGGGSPRGTLP